MWAAEPISAGRLECDGVRIGYQVFGTGEPTILLMPTWCIVHSRVWKMQIPYLARHHRVVTFDGPGNGTSDRPSGPAAYTAAKHVAFTLAVLEATNTERAIAVCASGGTHRTVRLAAGGEPERALATDYNAEMIEHIARYPRLRDRSIFVGNADDIVPDSFGQDLPSIREWTETQFDFAGYVTGFDPAELPDRETLRHELGFHPDETICMVSVGGSGVGGPLLHKIIRAFPIAKQKLAELRMIVVAGPRIDPVGLDAGQEDLEIWGFVPNLFRHLAACDVAVVQGGLTTAMELTANRKPFLYFPLAHHFEQNFHVPHRLNRYRAGRRMDYAASDPDAIATALAEELDQEVDYLPVETDGAKRSAGLIGELL